MNREWMLAVQLSMGASLQLGNEIESQMALEWRRRAVLLNRRDTDISESDETNKSKSSNR